ncbi:MAG: hypothetical protein HGA14_01965 [Chlorobaculum sp.]|nr:hypothetical protein [Chlorobaculum sp.]
MTCEENSVIRNDAQFSTPSGDFSTIIGAAFELFVVKECRNRLLFKTFTKGIDAPVQVVVRRSFDGCDGRSGAKR